VHGQDVIINLATHLPDSMTALFRPGAWAENDRLRREASAGLADAGIKDGVPRFIQESFALVYPDRGDEWIDEATELVPVRYNRTVADAEASAERYTAAGGVGIVLRFGAFYGPDAFQIGDFAQALRYGWALLPGRPDAYISSISHDDAALAAAAVLEVPAGTYNVVDDEPVSRRDYFNSLAQALGLKEPHLLPAWTAVLFGSIGEMLARSQRISNQKLREATPWAPQYPNVRSGFPAMVAEMHAGDSSSREKAA
jgi:2-alkyl-3-oxoalkanoate reductase